MVPDASNTPIHARAILWPVRARALPMPESAHHTDRTDRHDWSEKPPRMAPGSCSQKRNRISDHEYYLLRSPDTNTIRKEKFLVHIKLFMIFQRQSSYLIMIY